MPETQKERREIAGVDVDELAGVEVPQVGESRKAVIGRMIRTTAGEIFGDKTATRQDETLEDAKARPMLWLSFEGEGFVGTASMTISASHKSNLARFVARYGSKPKRGLAVSASLGADGYYKLDL